MHPVSIVIASYGSKRWKQLAQQRAWPSARVVGATECVVQHVDAPDAATARNIAAKATKAPYLVFLDADDELDRDYLNAMHKLFSPRMLLAPYVSYINKGIVGKPIIPNAGGWPNSNDAVVGTCISRALFFEVGGFRSEYWPWNDWELWLRCIKAGASKIHVPGAVYRAHVNPYSDNMRLGVAQGRALHAKVKTLHRELWT